MIYGYWVFFWRGCLSVDVVQSVILQIEVISVFSTLYRFKQIRVCLMALFSHVNANTGRIHIHVPTSKRERERGRGRERERGGEEGRDIFFPPLFLPLSQNKNTLNPFRGMLRIRSNRLFFSLPLSLFLSLSISGYKRNASLPLPIFLSLFLFSHINTHTCTHTRALTWRGPCGARVLM